VLVRNVMPEANSFWVLYGQHTKPTYLEDAGNGQQAQRDAALQYVEQWRVGLDIGSNIGQWTRPLSSKFESVVCFEPNPNFRECFKKNIQEKNVLLWPYGLSDKEHKAKQDFNSTVLQKEDGDIDCRTLDSFGLTNVDFVKIDVDGFEVPLLNGARETLTKNDPVINIEMKRDKRIDVVVKCESILKDLGYKFQKRTKSDEVWLKS
jgi:FkbM family methyltransferase